MTWGDTQLIPDADQLAEMGFAPGEELFMPLPYLDDDESDEEQAAAPPPKPPAAAAPPPKPSAEHVKQVLYGAPAHAHSDRDMANSAIFSKLRDGDGGEYAIADEARLPRVDYASLSTADFEAQHQSSPCVLVGVPAAEGWPAASTWPSEAAFVEELGAHLQLPIAELFPAHGMGKPQKLRLPLDEYRAYASSNTVDFPYYPWERDFDSELWAALLSRFWPPSKLFAAADDLFEITREVRDFFPFSCHRFIIVGGERTGAVVHQDPKCSGAWNTCLFGTKRWVFFPPTVTREQLQLEPAAATGDAATDGTGTGGGAGAGEGEDYRRVPPAYWWASTYPALRRRGGLGMREVLQRPGDTVYVPPRWWHAVLNLPDDGAAEALTLCVTQNVLTAPMLLELLGWRALRAHWGEFALGFACELRRHRPAVAVRLLAGLPADELRQIDEEESRRRREGGYGDADKATYADEDEDGGDGDGDDDGDDGFGTIGNGDGDDGDDDEGGEPQQEQQTQTHQRLQDILTDTLTTALSKTGAGRSMPALLRAVAEQLEMQATSIDGGGGGGGVEGASSQQALIGAAARALAGGSGGVGGQVTCSDGDGGDKEARYAAEVARRAQAAVDARRAAHEGAAAQGAAAAAERPPYAVDTVEATALSLADFRRAYVRRGAPVLLTGLGGVLTSPAPMTAEWLVEAVGSKQVGVRVQHRRAAGRSGGEAGAAGAEAGAGAVIGDGNGNGDGGDGADGEGECGSGEGMAVLPLRELVARMEAGEADGLYMYDVSLRQRLPGLLHGGHLRLPRHVQHCYLRQTRHTHAFSASWPTLFLGGDRTSSSLHLDQWHGHFWMYVVYGEKRWTLYHPDDAHLLYPSWEGNGGGLYPTFPTPAELAADPAAYPLYPTARRAEVRLRAGELLFVPAGTPHHVDNCRDTLAVAGNFLDDSNYARALAEMRVMGLRDAAVAAAADALDEMDFDADDGMVEGCLPADQLVFKVEQ